MSKVTDMTTRPGYAVIAGRIDWAGGEPELRVLRVAAGLPFEAAVALLAEREPGTVGHIVRNPARLPQPGDVLPVGAEAAVNVLLREAGRRGARATARATAARARR
jgi:hypothetical protein